MHLVASSKQEFHIAGRKFAMRRGESIHTENSYKFTPQSIGAIVERAGFGIQQSWTDDREWFGVYLAASL